VTSNVTALSARTGGYAERRAAARDAYRQALADGETISGAELGRRFGMSDRWGRARVTEVHDGDTALPTGEPVAIGRSGAQPPVTQQAGHRPIHRAAPPPASGVAAPGGWVRVVIRWIAAVAVVGVAACAARASYDHQRTVVEMAGEHDAAWYLPLSVDGMMLVASLNMLVRRWDNQPAGRLTWCALLLGGIASLGANVAAAEPTVIGRLVAAWPPICLIVSYELLMQQLPTREGGQNR
jgi:hypothetical protein